MKQLLVIFALILSVQAFAQDTQAANGQVIQLDTNLVVRSEPSATSYQLGTVNSRQFVTIRGRTADNMWLQIEALNGAVGWVYAEYVEMHDDLLQVPVAHSRNIIGMTADLSPEVTQNIRQIYTRGQSLGNSPYVFSKVGDSITYNPAFMNPFGYGQYELVGFGYLQPTIDYFMLGSARYGNPFVNPSLAAMIGWTTEDVLDPRDADPEYCNYGESPLACEYRWSKPSVALIMLGTNDVGLISPSSYYYNMEQIIIRSIDAGVIPVLSTIPPRVGFEAQVEEFNGLVEYLATGYTVPLWDYGSAMQLLGTIGLDIDGVHPTLPAKGVKGAANFREFNLQSGYVVRNLTGLQMLDAVRRAIDNMPIVSQ